jgi:hypothetical protein
LITLDTIARVKFGAKSAGIMDIFHVIALNLATTNRYIGRSIEKLL